MTLHVLRAGLYTTVQDLGRPGWQGDGVPEGGAMDDVALRLANFLVGNAESAAGLEITLDGPGLRFDRDATIAIGGADLDARVDDAMLPPWRAVHVAAGTELRFGEPRDGCRAYLAIAGGIDVPPVLGSRATYVRAAIGGHEGRALRRGDVLPLGAAPVARVRPRRLAREMQPAYGDTVHVVAGPQLAALTPESRTRLFDAPFTVSARSDRMGFRLEGASLALASPVELLSAGVAMGTVQLPPDGAPIVLMADRQTTGGYPRLGEVATVDLPTLAQRRPGDVVRFAEVSLAEAQRLYLARERALALLRVALHAPA